MWKAQAPKFGLLVTWERVRTFTSGGRMWCACPCFGHVEQSWGAAGQGHIQPLASIRGWAPVSLKCGPSSFFFFFLLCDFFHWVFISEMSRTGEILRSLEFAERPTGACPHPTWRIAGEPAAVGTGPDSGFFLFTACAASPSCTWQCFVTKRTLQ